MSAQPESRADMARPPSEQSTATSSSKQDTPTSSTQNKRRRGVGIVTPNACTECRKKRAKVLKTSICFSEVANVPIGGDLLLDFG